MRAGRAALTIPITDPCEQSPLQNILRFQILQMLTLAKNKILCWEMKVLKQACSTGYVKAELSNISNLAWRLSGPYFRPN